MRIQEMIAPLADAEQVYGQSEIEAALDRMAVDITRDFAQSNPIVLCVMNGGVVIMGHLLTRLHFPLEVDYLHVTRYRGRTHGGALSWQRKPELPLNDRAVLIVDDILDEGHTLVEILDYCRDQQASQVATAVLVNKRHERKQLRAVVDYVGLEVADRYVFGFGMDYKGYLRNVPAIYAVKEN
ncbi:MAG: hypoxanthine-guanine phosphoribosyltransferase [Gammaproteobacteria bacterium]